MRYGFGMVWLAIAAALCACVPEASLESAALAPNAVKVVDDKFRTTIGLSGPIQNSSSISPNPLSAEMSSDKQWNLITTIGKTTHVPNTVLWFHETYTATSWKFYASAADERRSVIPLVNKSSDVTNCDVTLGMCNYSEEFSVDIDRRMLEAAAEQGYSIKLYAKNSAPFIVSIDKTAAAAQISAIHSIVSHSSAVGVAEVN